MPKGNGRVRNDKRRTDEIKKRDTGLNSGEPEIVFPSPEAQPNAKGVGTGAAPCSVTPPSPKFQTPPKKALIGNDALGRKIDACPSAIPTSKPPVPSRRSPTASPHAPSTGMRSRLDLIALHDHRLVGQNVQIDQAADADRSSTPNVRRPTRSISSMFRALSRMASGCIDSRCGRIFSLTLAMRSV